jgi:hypothetical protein
MKRNNKIKIPKITMSYKLTINEPKMKDNTLENNCCDIKELERFLGLLNHTGLNGTFYLKMMCDEQTLFAIEYQVKDGKLVGYEL